MPSLRLCVVLLATIALVFAQDCDYGDCGGGFGGFSGGGGGGGGGDDGGFDYEVSGETRLQPQTAAAPEAHSVNKRSAEDEHQVAESHVRVRRHQGRVGPVHTFVKTFHDGDFKWGVKHMVGKQFGAGGGGGF